MASGRYPDSMLTILTSLAVTMTIATAEAAESAALAPQLEAARRRWDSEAVAELLNRTREPAGAGPVALRVEAGLALAEILRVEFELTPEGEREQRRTLGLRIDVAADEALALLDELPLSSERERMRADLIATLIRSDFRARKYRDQLERAIGRALELNPANPRALVTAAKPLVFAPVDKGRDLAAARERLDRALVLAPDLESALLLRAEAAARAGNEAAARRDWRRALDANPDCLPARRALAPSTAGG